MEATIRDVGKDGVLLALEDSMAAAQARRENDQLTAEMEALRAENERLKAAMKRQKAETTRLRKDIRQYRKQHFEAYRKYIAGESETQDEKFNRITRYLIAFSGGMFSIMILTMMAMVFFG